MHRTIGLLLLSAALLLATGCQEGPALVEPEIVAPRELPPVNAPHGDHDYHDLLNSLEYEEIEGELNYGMSAILYGFSITWPVECPFAIFIPADALGPPYEEPPPNPPPPTTFSLRFPTYQSYLANPGLPLILRLQPEGLHFYAPITVSATWMPWVDELPAMFWNAEPVYDGHGQIVNTEFNEHGWVTVLPVPQGWQVSFSVDHFSDWEVGDIPEAQDEGPYIEMWDDQNR